MIRYITPVQNYVQSMNKLHSDIQDVIEKIPTMENPVAEVEEALQAFNKYGEGFDNLHKEMKRDLKYERLLQAQFETVTTTQAKVKAVLERIESDESREGMLVQAYFDADFGMYREDVDRVHNRTKVPAIMFVKDRLKFTNYDDWEKEFRGVVLAFPNRYIQATKLIAKLAPLVKLREKELKENATALAANEVRLKSKVAKAQSREREAESLSNKRKHNAKNKATESARKKRKTVKVVKKTKPSAKKPASPENSDGEASSEESSESDNSGDNGGDDSDEEDRQNNSDSESGDGHSDSDSEVEVVVKKRSRTTMSSSKKDSEKKKSHKKKKSSSESNSNSKPRRPKTRKEYMAALTLLNADPDTEKDDFTSLVNQLMDSMDLKMRKPITNSIVNNARANATDTEKIVEVFDKEVLIDSRVDICWYLLGRERFSQELSNEFSTCFGKPPNLVPWSEAREYLVKTYGSERTFSALLESLSRTVPYKTTKDSNGEYEAAETFSARLRAARTKLNSSYPKLMNDVFMVDKAKLWIGLGTPFSQLFYHEYTDEDFTWEYFSRVLVKTVALHSQDVRHARTDKKRHTATDSPAKTYTPEQSRAYYKHKLAQVTPQAPAVNQTEMRYSYPPVAPPGPPPLPHTSPDIFALTGPNNFYNNAEFCGFCKFMHLAYHHDGKTCPHKSNTENVDKLNEWRAQCAARAAGATGVGYTQK